MFHRIKSLKLAQILLPKKFCIMLFFAIFIMGYFLGVFTALAIFPPRVTEIEEQEKNTLQPIIDISRKKLSPTLAQNSDLLASN